MASMQQRLADLLLAPRENLDCEIKNWLDLVNSPSAKATFAKAVLALANHGGGFVIFGLAQTTTGFTVAPDRPATLDGYDQDLINGIVANYCDPVLHCSVSFVAAPDGDLHPIVAVPGGHRMPVRAKRASPDNKTVQNNAIYMRRPGPRSETPQTSQDWDMLLARCQNNRRDELFDQIRAVIVGAVPPAPPAPEPDRLGEWIERCRVRWSRLIESVAPNTGPRMPHGRYSFGYEIIGDRRPVTLVQFQEVLRTSVVRHTGWPPFWLPTRLGIAPYAMDDAIECWIGGDNEQPAESRDAAHADFWRIDPSGLAYLIRGYQEDDLGEGQGRKSYPPAAVFDLVLPVWRIGEVLLHAERLAADLFKGPTTVKFSVTYEGLAGRTLVSLDGRRMIYEGRVAHQDEITLTTHVDAQAIGSNLPEIVQPLLEPLYSLFDFFVLPSNLVTEELARMRSGFS